MSPFILAGFTAFLSLYAVQPLLPLFERVFGADHFHSSLTVTATTVGVAIAAPFVGRVADVCGKRLVIVTASVLLSVTVLFAGTARSLSQIIAWRFAQGIATPGVFAVAVAYIHDRWQGARAATTTAAYVSGTVVGGFVGRVVAGQAAAIWGWRGSFVAVGAMSAVCALILAVTLPREGQSAAGKGHGIEGRGRWSHLATRPLVGTYLAGFCVLFAQIAMFTYVTFHLAAPPFELSTAALGWLFTVYLAGAIITPISGRWINRYGYRAALGIAIAIGVAGSALTLGRTLAEVVAGLALVASGVFVAQAAANGYIGVAARSDRGLAVGMYATCYYIGGSVGGAVPALFWTTGGWPACVALVIVVQLATAALGWAFWRQV
ncbi:MAG TPA: MFS transporter [Vicinamibacterales bacterium]|nr:MFS transporter [Vicinamibacterales bacterium]